MKIFLPVIIPILVLIGSVQTELFSQQEEKYKSKPIEEKLRLPIPKDKSKHDFYSLKDEIAILISKVADQLYIDEIIVCIQVDTTIENPDYAIRNALINDLIEIRQYDEAIVLTKTGLTQKEIISKEEDGFFSKINDQKSKQITTTFAFSSYFLDIKTGENLGSFELEITESAKTRQISRARVLQSFKNRLRTELKRAYWLSADVDSIKNGKITIPLGTKHGINKGLIFDLVEPERIWTDDTETWITQSGPVGLVTVIDTFKESSTVKLLRKWNNFYNGSWVVEHFNPIFALELLISPPTTNRYFNLGILYHVKPLNKVDFGGGFQFIRIADSFSEDNYGFGFSGFGIWRFIDRPRFDLGGKITGNLDIPFKKDYLGSTVLTSLFSGSVDLLVEFTVNQRLDFVINTGYRYTIKTDEWTYTEDDESFPAVWENEAPQVDNTGFLLSLGFKYFLF